MTISAPIAAPVETMHTHHSVSQPGNVTRHAPAPLLIRAGICSYGHSITGRPGELELERGSWRCRRCLELARLQRAELARTLERERYR